eukprot:47723_1
MGVCCGQALPEYTHSNMDSQEEQKFLDAQEIPTDPTGLVLSDQLELFLKCTNLPKLDIGSPSDPFIVISQKMDKDGRFHEITKTEMVRDNNNPEFTKPIVIAYHFEEVQLLRLDIYDADGIDLSRLSKHDFIGSCEFVLADLVNQPSSSLKMIIKDKKGKPRKYKHSPCTCTIKSEEIKTNHDQFLIQFECKELEKPSWTTRPNPFLQVYRQSNDGVGWMSILRTPRFIKTQNARWHRMKIPIQRLCNGDYGRGILIKCFHDKDDRAPTEIGSCTTSLQALLDETSKALTKGGKACGTICFSNTEIIKRHGFLEYVMGGMNIEMMIGIDFTGSNGDPKTGGTLHYIGPPKYESPYMRAIRSVGRVVEAYDSDKQIGAFGFGANINPFGEKNISHCFNLTLTQAQTVNGIEGVLQTYVDCLNKIQLYGPTNFAEIINTCAAMVGTKSNNEREQNYMILMMVTDGIITDMRQTTDAIVSASNLPLSIIIIGLGDADFSAMDALDADDKALYSSAGVAMKRDIVQFVEFNKYRNGPTSLLAKAVLEEIPAQITGYMTINKLHPLRHVQSQATTAAALTMYSGPNTMVRAGTQFVKDMNDQPVNPYYSPQIQTTQQTQQLLQPTQTGYNPANALQPTAPLL